MDVEQHAFSQETKQIAKQISESWIYGYYTWRSLKSEGAEDAKREEANNVDPNIIG